MILVYFLRLFIMHVYSYCFASWGFAFLRILYLLPRWCPCMSATSCGLFSNSLISCQTSDVPHISTYRQPHSNVCMFAYIQDYFLGSSWIFQVQGTRGGEGLLLITKNATLFFIRVSRPFQGWIPSTLLHHRYWIYQTSLLNFNPFPFNSSIPSMAMWLRVLGESCIRVEAEICYDWVPSSFFTFNYKVFNTKIRFPHTPKFYKIFFTLVKLLK